MAKPHAPKIVACVFAIGMWVALILPPVAKFLFGTGQPMTEAEWELLFEASTFTAITAAIGFAVARCDSALQALCAVPIVALLIVLVPSHWAMWLSETFRSVTVNAVVAGLVFAVAGAVAGWLVSRFFNRYASHA
jgi:hypothetical protein